jgi:DNA polymerase III delta subunit|nr:MAG TPA: DNA polymerase III, delta subunit [Caudoviricetes sp.]
MELVELNRQLRTNNIGNFYIFTGDEIGLQNVYLKQFGEYKRVDTVSEVLNKLTTRGFGFNKSTKEVYVVRDDLDFLNNKHLEENIKQLEKAKLGTLIVQITTANKKAAWYKTWNYYVVEFKKLTPTQLIHQIQHYNLTTDKKTLEYFVNACNNDYTTIINEIDKYNRLKAAGVYKEFTMATLIDLMPVKYNYTVFDLVDMILSNNCKAINVLDYLLSQNSNPLGILSLLYKNVSMAILVIGHKGQQGITEKTGLPYWQIKKILNNTKISPGGLLAALRFIQQYDNGIKSGKYSPEVGVQCCILNILNSH